MQKTLSVFHFLLFALVSSGICQSTYTPPDPNRFSEQIGTFETWDLKNSSPENAILFVGSSSIAGWNTAEAFPDFPVINRGFGGSHISDQLYFYDQVIGRFDPALIVFYCGENDIHSGTSLDQTFTQYKELIERIENDFPDAHFLYVSIKNSSSRLNQIGNFSEFNTMVMEFNQKNEQMHYIDLASLLTTDGTQPDDNFFISDQLHLNSAGYDKWNEKLLTVLQEMVGSGLLPY